MSRLAPTIALGLAAACAPKAETPKMAAAPISTEEKAVTSVAPPAPTNENNAEKAHEPDLFANRIGRALDRGRDTYFATASECAGATINADIKLDTFKEHEAANVAVATNATEACVSGYVDAMNDYFTNTAIVRGSSDVFCTFNYASPYDADEDAKNVWYVDTSCINLDK